MIKVMVVVGTRPELIRLSATIARLDKELNLILVHTGQNYDYELNQVFFDDLGIRKPDYFLNLKPDNSTTSIGSVISEVGKLIENVRPNAFLVLGDTNSCLSVIAAKKNKIPVFHMEAGNRCYDQRVPEELNRKIVDHCSDIHMPYSTIARDYLIAEGIAPQNIIKTGSPLKEVLNLYSTKIHKSEILNNLDISKEKYYLISLHRQENLSDLKRLNRFVLYLNELALKQNCKVIFSTHPRTESALHNLNKTSFKNITFCKPFSFTDYIKLQLNAKCVLSDSGTITEEASILKFKAINLRECNERPEGWEDTCVMMTGLEPSLINISLEFLENMTLEELNKIAIVEDYRKEDVSRKVCQIIISHVRFVEQNVWKNNI